MGSPGLRNDQKVLFDLPQTLAEFDEEWIGVLVLQSAGPVAAVLVRKHYLPKQDFVVAISSNPVVLDPV